MCIGELCVYRRIVCVCVCVCVRVSVCELNGQALTTKASGVIFGMYTHITPAGKIGYVIFTSEVI